MKNAIFVTLAALTVAACGSADDALAPAQRQALNTGQPVKIHAAGGLEVYKMYVPEGVGTDYETATTLYIVPNATTMSPYSCGKSTCYTTVQHGAAPGAPSDPTVSGLNKLTLEEKAALGLNNPRSTGLAKLTPEERTALGVK